MSVGVPAFFVTGLKIRGARKQNLHHPASERGKTFLYRRASPSATNAHAIDYSNSFVIGREFRNKRFRCSSRFPLRTLYATKFNYYAHILLEMLEMPDGFFYFRFHRLRSRVACRFNPRVSPRFLAWRSFLSSLSGGFPSSRLEKKRETKKHLGDFLPRPRKESSRKCGLRSTIPF